MALELDPELEALMAAARAANPNRPHSAEIPVEAFRAGYVMLSQAQSLAGVVCRSIEDKSIPGPAGDIRIREYVPVNVPQGPLPCLVFSHGGGFMIGDLESHDSVCRQLANGAGCKLIALDYRLAPEYPFPAAVEDVVAAVTYICDHAAEMEIDPGRIAVGGDSAGGNLSAVVANTLGAGRLKFQLLIYPSTDMTRETESKRALAEGVILDKRTLEYFHQYYYGVIGMDPADERISPIMSGNLAGAPPAHVVTAQYDPLRDEGKAYADALSAAGVAVTYHCYGGLMHNFIQQTGVVSSTRKAVDEMAGIVGKALRV